MRDGAKRRSPTRQGGGRGGGPVGAKAEAAMRDGGAEGGPAPEGGHDDGGGVWPVDAQARMPATSAGGRRRWRLRWRPRRRWEGAAEAAPVRVGWTARGGDARAGRLGRTRRRLARRQRGDGGSSGEWWRKVERPESAGFWWWILLQWLRREGMAIGKASRVRNGAQGRQQRRCSGVNSAHAFGVDA